MIEYKKGDIIEALFEDEIDAMAHGVNCKGGFGSGIAGQLRETLPHTARDYRKKFLGSGWRLGDVQEVVSYRFIIYNCATQDDFGGDGKKYVSYDAVYECMNKLHSICEVSMLTLGLPRIGAGLAGGSWDVIHEIIKDVFKDSKVKVIIYEL